MRVFLKPHIPLTINGSPCLHGDNHFTSDTDQIFIQDFIRRLNSAMRRNPTAGLTLLDVLDGAVLLSAPVPHSPYLITHLQSCLFSVSDDPSSISAETFPDIQFLGSDVNHLCRCHPNEHVHFTTILERVLEDHPGDSSSAQGLLLDTIHSLIQIASDRSLVQTLTINPAPRFASVADFPEDLPISHILCERRLAILHIALTSSRPIRQYQSQSNSKYQYQHRLEPTIITMRTFRYFFLELVKGKFPQVRQELFKLPDPSDDFPNFVYSRDYISLDMAVCVFLLFALQIRKLFPDDPNLVVLELFDIFCVLLDELDV